VAHRVSAFSARIVFGTFQVWQRRDRCFVDFKTSSAKAAWIRAADDESSTMQQPSPSEETQNLLARLAQRPGVQSTLILSRDTGAIVRSSGLVTAEEIGEDGTAAAPANGTYVNGTDSEVKRRGTRKAEDVAQLVYNFVKSAGSMIEELNGEVDEAKLLRVRTKKNELVIVPGMSISPVGKGTADNLMQPQSFSW
jgi:dynein light chain roadblock-type